MHNVDASLRSSTSLELSLEFTAVSAAARSVSCSSFSSSVAGIEGYRPPLIGGVRFVQCPAVYPILYLCKEASVEFEW